MTEPTTPDVDEILEDAVGVYSGDLSKLDVYADSVEYYDPVVPDGVHGREAFEEYLREGRTAFPDAEVTIDDVLAGDELLMTEWTWNGTHEGEYGGVPPTERTVEITGMSKSRIADGKIREDRLYWDQQDFRSQLGVTE